ncbi:MFS general substrate transporter [Mollisia scopiformis]|uniref:MFS general substrate transporter n=1 Tax=Mollisia scopiformis TaxID=149040 RepID=A0A132B2S2_MOLSC|nr:MFS general substrate transporter [Mollisia scopiformis]KUJ06696.1 MFS general substrate transporter [Mollisia scopiformis]
MGLLRDLRNGIAHFAGSVRMSPAQATTWLSCWSAWTLGSFQFYLLPFTLASLAKYLDVEQTKISEANTTTMLSRLLGAIIFGIASDQYGRKIPLLIDLVLVGVLTLCSGFIHTYGQLVGVRLLFGIAYGVIYGLITAAALEAVPKRARGIVSGLTQQGFAAGYMLASGFHLAMADYEWRALFWLGAGLSVPVFLLRLFLPTISVAATDEDDGVAAGDVDARAVVGGNLSFIKKLKYVLRHHFLAVVYMALLSACFATMGHGSFDLYPTFLTVQRKLTVREETWVTILLQSGGISGALVGGYLGNRYSLKWVPFCFALFAVPFLPLYALPSKWNLLGLGAFFMEFGYGGAIGNLGNIFQQICPHPGMRAAFGGVSYNIGNAISSIAPTIETSLGERFPTAQGTPDYAKTQLILVGIIVSWTVATLFGFDATA